VNETTQNVASPSACARLCAINFGSGGSCEAWDWYDGTCEFSSTANTTDPNRNIASIAIYGAMTYPEATGYTEQVTTGVRLSGTARAGSPVSETDASACRKACNALDWSSSNFTAAPTQCKAWAYDNTAKLCTFFTTTTLTSSSNSSWTSGVIVTQSASNTASITCPSGTPMGGGVTCPFTTSGVSTVVESTFYSPSGKASGWQGMCGISSSLVCPLEVSVTCCS